MFEKCCHTLVFWVKTEPDWKQGICVDHNLGNDLLDSEHTLWVVWVLLVWGLVVLFVGFLNN